jgi:hypothetical protein
MKRVLLVVVAVVAALLVVPGGTAMACSCVGLTPAESVAGADVVLQGTVSDVDLPSRLSSSADPAVYTVRVARVFKGEAAVTTFVQSAASGASCGLEGVEPGREYVLFAQQKGGELWSGLCGGSGPATADLVADVQGVVGGGAAPPAAPATQDASPSEGPVRELPGQRNPSAGDTAWLVPLVGGSVLALLLGAGLVLVLVRGRRRS